MVKIFGYEVLRSSEVKDKIENIEKALQEQSYTNLRPSMDILQLYGSEGIRIPWFPLSYRVLYDLAFYSDVLKNIINSLNSELFRMGTKIEENFTVKCNSCGKEYEKKMEICDACGSIDMVKPDTKQKEKLEEFAKSVNKNEQTLIDLCKTLNPDLEVIDDTFAIFFKQYVWDESGKRVGYIPVELVRGNPLYMRILADKSGVPGVDDKGMTIRTCLNHRDRAFYGDDVLSCPQCGKELEKAYYIGIDVNGKYIHYIKGEVFHRSKYSPSLTYGFPQVLTVWQKVVTLVNQDKYIKDYYSRQRPPRGLLFVNSSNIGSIEKAWQWMMDMFKKNPHMIPPIPVENQGGGKIAEFIDFMRTLDEMQFTETRNEFRKQIGAVYGVMPIFAGETAGAGNEGLQIVVTARAVETGQSIYNEGLFPWVLEQLGITDYTIKLTKPEYRDEMTVQQIQTQKISNAQAMKNLGFDVEMNEEGEFEFKATKEGAPAQQTGRFGIPVTPAQNPLQAGEQRFAGEPTHSHQGETQRFAGDAQSVYRGLMKCPDCGMFFENEEDRNRHMRIWHDEAKEEGAVESTDEGADNARYSPKTRRQKIRGIFDDQLKKTGKFLNKDYTINKKDEEEIDFIADNLYEHKFEGLSKTMSERLKDYFLDAYSAEKRMSTIINFIKRLTGSKKTESEAELMAKTEMTALQNKAREWSYSKLDPDNSMKYKWIGPTDSRTTDICNRIKSKTKEGVSLETLKKITNEEAKKAGFEPRDFMPHIGCRHTFIKVV